MRAKHVVLARPRYDGVTKHTHRWSERLRELFEENGWTVTDCEIKDAMRDPVEKALRAAKMGSLFVFYGHGATDHLEGQDGCAICDPKNVALLGGRKIYVMACHSAMDLGDAAVENYGALVYFGYADFVHGYWNDRDESKNMMNVLGQCVNSGMEAWLARPERTAEEIEGEMRGVYKDWINHYLKSSDITDRVVAFQFSQKLRHNLGALTLLGNPQTLLHFL
uniref:Caspase domain-containing protein n=1 Tax=Candidatus Kentrum sp. UNK TaxID=2126344 RepID=A0A451AE56_9GAMM|nr:MAG: hypothetical protein BECKUNK1418G_GA0071005_104426 [Candidatus Kentron sp. UNK]VFK71062.1 MAG: hypothetical protein BECKUNK1418H_GA0071006_104826 [Candidatus Kentron sp. UNK]